MLENTIKACPDNLWLTHPNYWYVAYHTLFWTDYYLTAKPNNFVPPPPFTLSEFDPSGIMPDRIYSKDELLKYLEESRLLCFNIISQLSEENIKTKFDSPSKNYSTVEILLYNMRHVQHHAAQLNMLLRQNINDATKWVSQGNLQINENS